MIETTYTFRRNVHDGPEKRPTPRGGHDSETNAEWRMQFLWPFRAAYLIVYLDEAYRRTIIDFPSRRYVWIMSRDTGVSEAEYQALLDMATKWKKSSEQAGVHEGHDRETGKMKWTATPVDLLFGSHSELRAIAEVYADNGGEEKFVQDFVDAWTKGMILDRCDLDRRFSRTFASC